MQRTATLLAKFVGSMAMSQVPKEFLPAIEAATRQSRVNITQSLKQKFNIGSQPHRSSKDKDDDKEVITISHHTGTGTRVISVHVHNDNTYNEFPSRNAFKGK